MVITNKFDYVSIKKIKHVSMKRNSDENRLGDGLHKNKISNEGQLKIRHLKKKTKHISMRINNLQ